jgi:hypothetical protein
MSIVLILLGLTGLNAQTLMSNPELEEKAATPVFPVNNQSAQTLVAKNEVTNPTFETRLRVKGLYILPSGQTEKPRAKEAIAAILSIIQSHYVKQLGVTFEFDPVVAVVRSNYNVKDAVEWSNNLKFIKTNLKQEYVNNRTVVISVLEGTSGDAGGSFGVLKMTGDFWSSCYDIFINKPYLLSSELAGWSHELGHAFGLMHSEDTKSCLKDLNVDMGKLPNLLMQQTTKLSTVYDYPFASEEKKLLLDSTYNPSCLAFRGDRPAPIRYLKYNQVQQNKTTTGRNVVMVEYYSPSLNRGSLIKDASGKWLEKDLTGKTSFTFNEVGRDDWSVYLQDPSRNVALQLDLYTFQVKYGSIGATSLSPIYNILWAKK